MLGKPRPDSGKPRRGSPLDPSLLQLAVESSLDVILVLDANSLDEDGLPRIVYANAGAERQTGFTPEELIGRSTAIFYGPKTDRSIIATLQHISRTLEPISVEMINYRKDGSEFWVEINSRPVVDRNGAVAYWITVRRDVSRRKFVEEALRSSEEHYRLLFEANPNPMWVFDRQTFRFLAVNDAAVRFYGYPRQEFLSMTISDIRPSDEVKRLVSALSVAGDHTYDEVWRHVKRDGTQVDVSISSCDITWLGRPARLVLAVDTTDKRRAQNALRETAARLELMIAQMPALLFTTDRNLLITSHTGAAEAALGVKKNENVGRNVIEVVRGMDPSFEVPEFEQALHGRSSSYERPFAGRIYRTHIEPLRGQDGAIIGTIGVAIDITEAREQDRKVKEWEERYRLVSQATNDAVWDWNLQTDQTVWSDSVRSLFGYAETDIGADSKWWVNAIHPEDRDRVIAGVRTVIGGAGSVWSDDYRFRRGDSSYALVHDRGFVMRDQDGKGLRMIGSMQDVTAQRVSQEALRRSEARLAEAQRIARLGSWEIDLRARRLLCSNGIRAVIACSDDINPSVREFWRRVHPDDAAALSAAVDEARATGKPTSADHRITRWDGVERWVQSRIEFFYDAAGAPKRIFGTLMDIHERKEAERRISYLANFDELTGLPNHHVLADRLAQALVYARRTGRHVAVLGLDVNRFKQIGETLGRTAADELLRAIALRLGERVRPGDTLARVADDEFVVALADMAKADDAVPVAQSYLDALALPFVVSGREIFVQAGVGISLFPFDAADANGLIQKAESAMYEAKKRGDSAFQLFTPSLQESALERLSLESELRHAVDRGEFVVHYQPIVNLERRSVVGVEALVRWQHPKRGIIPPVEFIPIAEETGIIIRLGEIVLHEACRQVRLWKELGLPDLRVSVNISTKQFNAENFVGMVERVIAETKIDPAMLELEITESVVVRDVDAARRIFGELKATGVRLALDDFGTGYSALGYLKRFPFDTIKIDRSFVNDIATDPFDEAIAASVATLGRALDLNVTAEGVETESQLAVVKDLRCQEAQGYLFSRAVSAADLERLLRDPHSGIAAVGAA